MTTSGRSEQLTTPAIVAWRDALGLPHIQAGLDAIFFEASATKSFATEAERAAFRERWLGRYLTSFAGDAFVALEGGAPLGYIVGSLSNPARDPRFADLSHFREFADLTARFPAQLHVNVRADARGTGLGSRLVARFIEHARTAGAPGVHVVTSHGGRNIRFYAQNGFVQHGALAGSGRDLVFLAREL